MPKFTRFFISRVPVLFFVFLLQAPTSIQAQRKTDPETENRIKNDAQTYFAKDDLIDAYSLYSQLLSLYPHDPVYNYLFGACILYNAADKKKAVKYIQYAVKQAGVENLAYYYLGRALHLNYEFTEAISAYEKFQQVATSSELKKYPVTRFIEMCKNGKDLLAISQELDVLRKKELNSSNFFRAYNMHGNGGSLIAEPDDFKSKLDKDKKIANLMYVTPDRSQAFFSSYGMNENNGKDIYVINKKPDGTWGVPQNLGTVINTTFDEDYPVYDVPRHTLYFSSKGHNSMGGYDIFGSVYNDTTQTWSEPYNLDFPINTPDDDILLVPDTSGQTAFFASTRSSPQGKVDVYKIALHLHPPGSELIAGKVSNAGSATEVAIITVRDSATNKIIAIDTTSEDGHYSFNLPPGKYNFTVDDSTHKGLSQAVVLARQEAHEGVDQDIKFDESGKLQIKNSAAKTSKDSNTLQYIQNEAQMNVNVDTNNIQTLIAQNSSAKKNTTVASSAGRSDSSSTGINKNNNSTGGTTIYDSANIAQIEQSEQQSDNNAVKAIDYASNQMEQAQQLQEQIHDASINPNGTSGANADSIRKWSAESKVATEKGMEAYRLASEYKTAAIAKQAVINKIENGNSSAVTANNQNTAGNNNTVSTASVSPGDLIRQQAAQVKEDSLQLTITNDENTQEISGLQQKSDEFAAQAAQTSDPQQKAALSEQSNDLLKSKAQKQEEIKENKAELKQYHDEYVWLKNKAQKADSTSAAIASTGNTTAVNSASQTALQQEINAYSISNGGDSSEVAANSQGNTITQNQNSGNKNIVANNSRHSKHLHQKKHGNQISQAGTNIASTNLNNSSTNTSQSNNNTNANQNTQVTSTDNGTTSTNSTNNVSSTNNSQSNNNTNANQNTQVTSTDNGTTSTNPNNNVTSTNNSQSNTNTNTNQNTQVTSTDNGTTSTNPNNNVTSTNNSQSNTNTNTNQNTQVTSTDNGTASTNSTNNVASANNSQSNTNTNTNQNTQVTSTDNGTNSTNANTNITSANNSSNAALTNSINNHPDSLVYYRAPNNATLDSIVNTSSKTSTPTALLSNRTTNSNSSLSVVQYTDTASAALTQKSQNYFLVASVLADTVQQIRSRAQAEPDKNKAAVLYRKADSISGLIFQLNLKATEIIEEANTRQYSINANEITQITARHSVSQSENIIIARNTLKDADNIYKKALVERDSAISTEVPAKKRNYAEFAKKNLALAILIQQNAVHLYYRDDSIKALRSRDTSKSESALRNNYSGFRKILGNERPINATASNANNSNTTNTTAVQNSTTNNVSSTNQNTGNTQSSNPNNSSQNTSVSSQNTNNSQAANSNTKIDSAKNTAISATNTGVSDNNASSDNSQSASIQKAATIFTDTHKSAYSISKPIPVDPPLPTGLAFGVQVGAFRNSIPPNLFKGFKPIIGMKAAEGYVRYIAGLFSTFDMAKDAAVKIRNLGYPQAFIVAFYNGQRISLKDALAKLGGSTLQIAGTDNVQTNTTQVTQTSTAQGTQQTTQAIDTGSSQGIHQAAVIAGNTIAPSTETLIDTKRKSIRAIKDTIPPAAIPISDIKGLFYTVQVGSFSTHKGFTRLRKIKQLYSWTDEKGTIKYNSGTYGSVADARAGKDIIVANTAVKDAFVTAYYNGKRITIAQAKNLSGNAAETINTSNTNTITPTNNNTSATPAYKTIDSSSFALASQTKVIYTVRITSFSGPLPVDTVNKLLAYASEGIEPYKEEQGATAYYAGKFPDYAEATVLQQKFYTGGFHQAAVTAFYQGKKITLKEALSLTNK